MSFRWTALLPAIFWGLLIAGCAHVEAPPGGQEDRDPPVLLEVRPDTLEIIAPTREPAVFAFDERLSERGTEDIAFVSPRTSPIVVSRRGNELRVGLRGGWEPGHIYHVTLRSTLQDLWNNRIPEPIQLVFSTGPEIPETYLAGTVIDRITGEPELDVRVEAIRRPDSLVYAVPTDSAGQFTLGRIPVGEYTVRAFKDLNRDRSLDPFEPRDTTAASIVVGDTVRVELSLVMPDTTPPEVASAEVAAGGIIEVLFDDFLDPTQTIAPVQVRIFAADMTEVPVARVAVGRLEPRDAPAAEPDAEPAGQPPPRVAPVPGRGPQDPDQPRQLPSQTLAVEPAQPLAPETEYRIWIEGVRNVVGLMGGGEVTFTTPAAPAAPATPPAPPPAPPEPPDEPPEPPDEPPPAREPPEPPGR